MFWAVAGFFFPETVPDKHRDSVGKKCSDRNSHEASPSSKPG